MPKPQTKPQTAQSDLTDMLRRAGAHHQRGQLREAEELYRAILAARPDHFDALHLYGVLMHQRGRPAEALKLIGQALRSNDRAAPAHSNHGIVLAVLERHEEALKSYDRAIALKPDYAEALNNRGNALRSLRQPEEALASYQRALAIRPDYPEALNNRGNALFDLGRAEDALASYDAALARRPAYLDALINRANCLRTLHRFTEALASFEQALALKPDHADALNHRGSLLRELKRPAEALASFDRALALKPDDVDVIIARGNTHYEMKSFAAALADYDRALAIRPDIAQILNNRGNALREIGRHHDALPSFDRALALKPDYAEGFSSRGNALIELNRPAEALADYDRALALKADFADAFVNRGNALRYLNRADEALASFDRAIGINPDLAEAHWNKGLTCLSLGDFERGWRDYEWRWRCDNADGARDFSQSQWRGEDMAGKTILLHAEQGFGDTIQFVRYVPMVVAKGAKVILEVPDSLMPLIGGIDGVVAMVSRGEKLPPFDLHCPLLGLPLAFGTTLASIPAPVPYLRAPADRVEKWRARLPRADALRIGMVWSGESTHKNDRNRSIALSRLAPLLSLPGFEFVSLQREYRDGDLAELEKCPSLLRLDDELADFADTAAVVACLDLVITVDTAVAHLAGALGKPVWILLSHVLDWRWMLEREDSPWYPSARLIRQPAIGDWDSVIARLGQKLAKQELARLAKT